MRSRLRQDQQRVSPRAYEHDYARQVNLQTASEEALVANARGGNREAFAELILRHRRMLLVLCERRLRDPDLADDVTQEAVLQAFLGLDSLKRRRNSVPGS